MEEWLHSDPLVIERAEGNFLIDTDGRKYLDGVSSLWVNVHGHRKEAIDLAIIMQLGKVAHSTLLGAGSRPIHRAGEKARGNNTRRIKPGFLFRFGIHCG